MSERLSITINPSEEEWETLQGPFRRLGAKDQLIAEVREALHADDPDWVGKARDGGNNLAADRLQEIADAAQAKADKIANLPGGEQRDKAHAAAVKAADTANKLLAELNFSGPSSSGGQHGEHHQHHTGVAV